MPKTRSKTHRSTAKGKAPSGKAKAGIKRRTLVTATVSPLGYVPTSPYQRIGTGHHIPWVCESRGR